jgi:hypothetical protein
LLAILLQRAWYVTAFYYLYTKVFDGAAKAAAIAAAAPLSLSV